MSRMIETVEAFDPREGLDVEVFLAFADRVRAMAGYPVGSMLNVPTPIDPEAAAELRRQFTEASSRPASVILPITKVVITATTTMRGRVRKLTAKVEAS